MKKTIWWIVGIIIVVAVGLIFLRGDEDTWICSGGQWVKHGNPSASMPTSGCGQASGEEKPVGDVVVETPLANALISSPLEITGKAKGGWYFEASFPVKLTDAAGKTIASAVAQAQSDWMTEDYVPFKATLTFAPSAAGDGFLVFEKDNPSDLPQNAGSFSLPVKFVATETTTIKVFFNNDKLDPQISCNKVFPVERIIPKTEAIGRAALEELLKGTNDDEKDGGYTTSINNGVKINSLVIENGIAKVDFDQAIQYQVGGSCRVSAIRAQITETLKQFSSVKEVVISVNGNSEEALQP